MKYNLKKILGIRITTLTVALLATVVGLLASTMMPLTATAAEAKASNCKSGKIYNSKTNKCVANKKHCDPKTQIFNGKKCVKGTQKADKAADKKQDAKEAAAKAKANSHSKVDCNEKKCDLIDRYINPAINLLSVSFGLIATISLILGGINYATSEGDPTKASKAKHRIANTIFAVVAYLFLYSFLQFLVPGGFF